MNKTGFSKNGLFLMELVFVILFFSICGAICLQMFAYASQRAQSAEDLSYATLYAQSAAECYQGVQGDLEQVAALMVGVATADGLAVTYDQNWQETKDEGEYVLTLTPQGTLGYIAVTTVEEGTLIYTLTVGLYGGDT